MKILRKQSRQYASVQQDVSHEQHWRFIRAYLESSDANVGSQSDIDMAMSVLPEDLVLTAYSDLIRSTFERKIVPALAQVIPSSSNLVDILQNLVEGLNRYQACLARLRIPIDGISGTFQALVRTSIHGNAWSTAVKDWLEQELAKDEDSIIVQVHSNALRIGLSDMFEKELKSILSTNMTCALSTAYANVWSTSVLEEVLASSASKSTDLLRAMNIDISSDSLETFLLEGLASLRISELFDIIIDFPSSIAALEDLKTCLKAAQTRAALVQEFSSQCRARLLHPGANTADIITIYISTIKVFLILDPPGVLLDKVARPIRKYLRERSDTIRCIIGSLLGEVDNELSLELSEDQMPEEVEDEDDPLWLPDPIDAAPDYAKNRASDIIGSLISIYENKDVFTRELQTLLADRLLAVTDYNIDQEMRNLELLKIRFGDGMLSVCDVMLKDISDSRRIDGLVHSAIDHDNVIHSTIVSRLYWPGMKSSTHRPDTRDDVAAEAGYTLPETLATMLSQYAAEFSKLKAQRNLVFQKDLGHVRVKLQLEDRELDMLVTPIHAACIHLFDNVDALSLASVEEKLNLPESDCRRPLSFWIKQGVLALQDGMYRVMEVAAVAEDVQGDSMEEVVAEVTEEVDEMSTYWNFVVGMLTNVGSLEPERIHSMLGMFAPSYDKSLDQLKSLLQRKTREGAVELKGGLYKLPAA